MTGEPERLAAVWRAARQEQFLNVASRDEAEVRFRRHLHLEPLGAEPLELARALGRILAHDVIAPVDVPSFDRSGMDGFAVRTADTVGARSDTPRILRLNPELLTPGIVPTYVVEPGTATVIATGGMVPRGADAVIMIEHTDPVEESPRSSPGAYIAIRRTATPGQAIAAAGSDIGRGETVLRAGQRLSSREIGILAAIGLGTVAVWRRPRVAIFSTGDEIIAPGTPPGPGKVYDSNAAILAAAVTECGGEPVPFGIAPDDDAALSQLLTQALAAADIVLLSGGTSKGAGDLAAIVVSRLRDPGVVVHGVALKPGKPLCLAVSEGKPVIVLPGFPTSAIFTFHEFVAPVIGMLAGMPTDRQRTVEATLPVPLSSETGRTEYVMASLVRTRDAGLAAYPIGKGSGAVTSFCQADGFFSVPALTESVPAGSTVLVHLIGNTAAEPADLVLIGSHCVGLDVLIGHLGRDGIRVKALAVGSSGGLAAAHRGECDVAAIHLLDPATGLYNAPFLGPDLALIPGYGRMQGLVFRHNDRRFNSLEGNAAPERVLAMADTCLMVNRNAGSGTRLVIDRLLKGARPPGYQYQTRSHNAVAAAVAQGRADWGVAIETVSRDYDLGFIALQAERFDFVVPKPRLDLAPVQRFIAALDECRPTLAKLGFQP